MLSPLLVTDVCPLSRHLMGVIRISGYYRSNSDFPVVKEFPLILLGNFHHSFWTQAFTEVIPTCLMSKANDLIILQFLVISVTDFWLVASVSLDRPVSGRVTNSLLLSFFAFFFSAMECTWIKSPSGTSFSFRFFPSLHWAICNPFDTDNVISGKYGYFSFPRVWR